MRVLFVGKGDRRTLALTQELAHYQIHVLQAESRVAIYELLEVVDAVLVDYLPDTCDLAILRAIRARSDVPIVVLADCSEIGEMILGSRAGADDYVCPPARAGTLIARIETIRRLRNRQLEPSGVLRVGEVTVDLRSRSVTVAGNVIELSPKEFHILAVLAAEGGAVCVREAILRQVWGDSRAATNETLYVHIATLRNKLGRPGLIETVRGFGYRLGVPVDLAGQLGSLN